MEKVFLKDYYPITSSIGFLQGDLPGVADFFEKWRSEMLGPGGVRFWRVEVGGSLPDLFSRLEPLTAPLPTKELFVGTVGDWVAFFDNGWRGPDPSSVVEVLSGRIGCQGVTITAAANTMPSRPDMETKGRFGATIFQLFEHGERKRTVYSANDGGKWVFGQSGKPLRFEDTARYQLRIKRHRFDIPLLSDYLRQLGIDAFALDFYRSDLSVMFERETKALLGYREYSLAEIEAEHL